MSDIKQKWSFTFKLNINHIFMIKDLLMIGMVNAAITHFIA